MLQMLNSTGKRFVIAGGGTAGYMAASLLQGIIQDADITLIESSGIGTIGVGESTTPAILDFLSVSNIDFTDFIQGTESTIKDGILFENWGSKSYLHTFDLLALKGHIGFQYLNNKHMYQEACDKNLVPFDALGRRIGTHALHINAIKLVEYLKNFLKDKVKFYDKKIIQAERNKVTGNIEKIRLEDNTEIVGDIFFDCTGFAKVLINLFKPDWQDCSKILPVDSALPFPFDWNEPMSFTHASALDHGWAWQVPVQGRVGSGYVFSSNFSKNPEETFDKFIKNKYKVDYQTGRTIKFTSGYLKNPWINNVVAVGLSAGFVEPLESTSIHMIYHQIMAFVQAYHGVTDDKISKIYNDYMIDMYEDTVAFIKLHYQTDNKSEFWQYMNSKESECTRLNDLLEVWNKVIPLPDHIGQNKEITPGYRLFAIAAWTQVLKGLDKIDLNHTQKFLNFEQYQFPTADLSKFITQKDFLKKISL
jgi:tryptophan halogenase